LGVIGTDFVQFDFLILGRNTRKEGYMARGGFRPGAGRPKGSKEGKSSPQAEVTSTSTVALTQNPLEYMLAIMNDPKADAVRRDRMAIAAAPFIHPRVADSRIGKKDAEDSTARKAAKRGRFAVPAPPKLAVDNIRS
jgi:hypothetical protein